MITYTYENQTQMLEFISQDDMNLSILGNIMAGYVLETQGAN